jgi:hypothetical protein
VNAGALVRILLFFFERKDYKMREGVNASHAHGLLKPDAGLMPKMAKRQRL